MVAEIGRPGKDAQLRATGAVEEALGQALGHPHVVELVLDRSPRVTLGRRKATLAGAQGLSESQAGHSIEVHAIPSPRSPLVERL